MINFPSPIQIILFLAWFYATFLFIVFLLRNKKVFNRKIKEYFLPVKLYFLGAAIAVFLQYLAMPFSSSARIGQILWELMIAFSVIILVKKYRFNLKNTVFLGILYALFIHGAKGSLRYFVYGLYAPEIYRTFKYIAGRFVYGSILALSIAIGVFFILSLIEETSKKQKDNKKIAKLVFLLILIAVILLISVMVYGKLM